MDWTKALETGEANGNDAGENANANAPVAKETAEPKDTEVTSRDTVPFPRRELYDALWEIEYVAKSLVNASVAELEVEEGERGKVLRRFVNEDKAFSRFAKCREHILEAFALVDGPEASEDRRRRIEGIEGWDPEAKARELERARYPRRRRRKGADLENRREGPNRDLHEKSRRRRRRRRRNKWSTARWAEG